MAQNKVGYTEGIGINIASHSFSEDGQTKHMERISPGAGVVDVMPVFVNVTVAGVAAGISRDVKGKGRIIVMAKAETGAGDYFTFRLVYKDANGSVMGVSKSVQPVFGEYSESTFRFSIVSAFANDVCASTVEIYIISLPLSGAVQLSVAAI